MTALLLLVLLQIYKPIPIKAYVELYTLSVGPHGLPDIYKNETSCPTDISDKSQLPYYSFSH